MAVLLPRMLTATALPLRIGPTFTRPNWPALVTLKPLPPWVRVSRLGSSSACSSSRSCVVTAGRVDMDPPSGAICLGRADRACPRPRVPRVSGTRPAPLWPRARVWCTFVDVHTVRLSPYSTLYPGVGQGLRIATNALSMETTRLAMTAHAAGGERNPPRDQPLSVAGAVEQDL